jgi:hypothetical protein
VAKTKHPESLSHLVPYNPNQTGDTEETLLLNHSPNPFRQSVAHWSDGTDESQNIGPESQGRCVYRSLEARWLAECFYGSVRPTASQPAPEKATVNSFKDALPVPVHHQCLIGRGDVLSALAPRFRIHAVLQSC